MDGQVIELLKATQSAEQARREAAEIQLSQLKSNDEFAVTLVEIGARQGVSLGERLSALIILKTTIRSSWSEAQDDYEEDPILQPQTKEAIRNSLLHLIFAAEDSKITSNAANAIAQIASSDFPDEWPTLINAILGDVVQRGDDQVHAILVVLDELLASGFDETSFYTYANDVIQALHQIATEGNRKLNVRAHAVSIFRKCFDFVETLKEKEQQGIAAFTENVCNVWAGFFSSVVQEPLPPKPSQEDEESDNDTGRQWRGVIALKTQVVMTLARIQSVVPAAMNTLEFFQASWTSLQAMAEPYHDFFVEGSRQGSLMDQYNLSYTLDALVAEIVDYLQTLLQSMAVTEHLATMREADKVSGTDTSRAWIADVLRSNIIFASITTESESLWDVDYNCFLSEETYAESNSTPRSVCAGFMKTLSLTFPQEALEGVLTYSQAVFQSQEHTWRMKEAVLFMLQQIVEEFAETQPLPSVEVAQALLQTIHIGFNDDNMFLRARSVTAAASVLSSWGRMLNDTQIVIEYANATLSALEHDPEDLVKATCIRIIREYLGLVTAEQSSQLQAQIVNAVNAFLDTQDFSADMDDYTDLIDAVLGTLRDTIMTRPETSLDHNALDVLLTLVKHGGAKDSNSAIQIDEAFESAAEAMARLRGDNYTRLCQKILPTVMTVMDLENPDHQQLSSLTDVSISILRILAEKAEEPVPSGFVDSALPRLYHLIQSDGTDFYQRQLATLAIKYMVINDKDTVFHWTNPQTNENGLMMCFNVIKILLNPQTADADAAEVGELAVTIIEQAGSAVLGSALNDLLQVIVQRLTTATHHDLVQSLCMVFARLALINAKDIVDFLSGLPVDVSETGALGLVLQKWLENAGHFAGFDAIRQNTQALVSLYRLRDPRVEAVHVAGDLVPDTDTRIKTRSMAKKQPIRYTQIPAPLKIVKLLIAELVPYGDPNTAFMPRASVVAGLKSPGLSAPRRPDSDDEWESEDEDGPFNRASDDQTQIFLINFFQAEGSDPDFQALFGQLSEAEQKRTKDAVEQHAQAIAAAQGH